MSFSRRKFLRAGTLVALSAGFPIQSLVAETRGKNGLLPQDTPLDKRLFLTRETFARYLKTKFSFNRPEMPSATLKLIEVNDLTPKEARRSAAATGKECFAVIFKGSEGTSLRQETYTVSHDSLGEFQMFVVPIGASREGQLYEAVFNRLN